MSGQHGKRARFLILPVLALAATAARADQTVNYVVRGPTGAAVWGLASPLGGTKAAIFAFTNVAPAQGNTPAPGPRVVFSVIQSAGINGTPGERQWFGDAALKPEWLVFDPNLGEARLDATVLGTLEQDGVVVRRDVPGRLQVRWVATGALANTTTAHTYQTSTYSTIVQLAGAGRLATANATVTVDALGPGVALGGVGSLVSVTSGLLSVTMP